MDWKVNLKQAEENSGGTHQGQAEDSSRAGGAGASGRSLIWVYSSLSPTSNATRGTPTPSTLLLLLP